MGVAAGASSTHASLSADYVALLRQRLGDSGYAFVNAGMNGSTSADLLERLDEIVVCRPDTVTILIGTNDARGHADAETSPEAFRDNLVAIVTRLRAESDADIALLSLAPLGEDSGSEINGIVGQYNAIIQPVAAEYEATYLPLNEALTAMIAEKQTRQPAASALRPGLLMMNAIRHYGGGQSWDAATAQPRGPVDE